MIVSLLWCLSSAAPATPLPQPHVVVTAPNARSVLVLASRFTERPLKIALMETFGIALDAPAYAYVVADEVVFELAVRDAKAVDAAMELGVAKKRAKKIGEQAIEVSEGKMRLFVVRAGEVLFAMPARGPWPSPAIEAARAATKPVMPKWIEKEGAPLAWGQARGIEGTERVNGAVFADGNELEVRISAALDFATGLLVADLANAPGKSRALFREKDVVAEVTAFLGSSAIANLFELADIAPAQGKNASGRVHAALTSTGALVLALEPREGGDGKTLRSAVAARLEGVDVRLGAPIGEEHAPIEVHVKPKVLLPALEARSKTKGPIRPLRQEVLMLKLGGSEVWSRIEDLRAEIIFGAAGVDVRARVEIAAER